MTNSVDPNVLAILQQIDGMYDAAWTRLLWFTTALIAVVGVIVPIVIQVYQRRSIAGEKKALEETLRSQVKVEVKEAGDVLRSDLVKQFDEQKKSIEKSIGKARESMEAAAAYSAAGVFFVQGGVLGGQGRFAEAADSYLGSIRHARKCGNEPGIQRAMTTITETCLPQMTKSDFEEHVHLSEEFDLILAELRANNGDYRYSDFIDKLAKAYGQAKQREKRLATSTAYVKAG